MANKIRTPISTGHVSVPAIFDTADLPKGTYLVITGDAEVDISANEDDFPVGYVLKAARAIGDKGTVQTRFAYLVDAECKGAIAAGERVKVGDTDDGVQTFKVYDAATDPSDVCIGVCWVGAGDDAVGTFLIF